MENTKSFSDVIDNEKFRLPKYLLFIFIAIMIVFVTTLLLVFCAPVVRSGIGSESTGVSFFDLFSGLAAEGLSNTQYVLVFVIVLFASLMPVFIYFETILSVLLSFKHSKDTLPLGRGIMRYKSMIMASLILKIALMIIASVLLFALVDLFKDTIAIYAYVEEIVINTSYITPAWGNYVIIVMFAISLVLALVPYILLIYKRQYNDGVLSEQELLNVFGQHTKDVDAPNMSIDEQLKQLNNLYEQKLITKEEYQQKRNKILDI